tara:strand:- start:499 stop:978 length:480 start_codon:yes stop_codon:yes gene_type:complete
MNHEYEYYVKRFNYLNYGIVFDENPYCSDEITNNDWKRVSRSLARGYHGIAIFHSHDTIKRGGRRNPHVHLLLDVPIERQELFNSGLEHDLKRTGRASKFKIAGSTKDKRVIHNWKRYLAYCLGELRENRPCVIWRKPQQYVPKPTVNDTSPVRSLPLH